MEEVRREKLHANVDFSRRGSKSNHAIVGLTHGASTILFLPWRDIERIKRGRSGQDRGRGKKGERDGIVSSSFETPRVASNGSRNRRPGAKWLWWSSLKRKREDVRPGRWQWKKDSKIGKEGQNRVLALVCRTEVSWNTIAYNTYAVVLAESGARFSPGEWVPPRPRTETEGGRAASNCATWPILARHVRHSTSLLFKKIVPLATCRLICENLLFRYYISIYLIITHNYYNVLSWISDN